MDNQFEQHHDRSETQKDYQLEEDGSQTSNYDLDDSERNYGINSLEEYPQNQGDFDFQSMLCILCIIFFNVFAHLLCQDNPYRFQTGGINYSSIFDAQEYTRLLSHMYIHADIDHLASNMIALFFLGSKVEKSFGSFRTFLLYFISGIGAAFISIFTSHFFDSTNEIYSAGASGAVYGILAAAMVLTAKERHSQSSKQMKRAILLAILYAIFSMSTGIDVWAHIGGALIGGVLAFFYCLALKEKKENTVLKYIAIFLTIILSTISVLNAYKANDINLIYDQRKEQIRDLPVFEKQDVTYGMLLDATCENSIWYAFTSDDGQDIVEFTGVVTDKGIKREVMVQFKVASNSICYLGFDNLPQSSSTVEEFFNDLYVQYKELQ